MCVPDGLFWCGRDGLLHAVWDVHEGDQRWRRVEDQRRVQKVECITNIKAQRSKCWQEVSILTVKRVPAPRIPHSEMWQEFFQVLLNIPDCSSLPSLPRLREKLTEVLQQNYSSKLRTLKGRLLVQLLERRKAAAK